jgi:S-adenosylmethionine hydrolase
LTAFLPSIKITLANSMRSPLIVLLTDFGTRDSYVGVMKGVISGIAPRAGIIDLGHHVQPGDIFQGAFHLWQAAPYFPEGTIFLAVVDPGVGTQRAAMAAEAGGRRFVLPDNGLLTLVSQRWKVAQAVALENPAYQLQPASSTFHGRDVFAPAAAYLAAGQRLNALGPRLEGWDRLPLPNLSQSAGAEWRGEVIHLDRFGNAVTSLGLFERQPEGWQLQPWLPGLPARLIPGANLQLRLPDGTPLELKWTFADASPGQAIAYIGSDGLLEIAVNQGRAADQLGLQRGSIVRLEVRS